MAWLRTAALQKSLHDNRWNEISNVIQLSGTAGGLVLFACGHTHHLSLFVKCWSTTVARVDGRIDLNDELLVEINAANDTFRDTNSLATRWKSHHVNLFSQGRQCRTQFQGHGRPGAFGGRGRSGVKEGSLVRLIGQDQQGQIYFGCQDEYFGGIATCIALSTHTNVHGAPDHVGVGEDAFLGQTKARAVGLLLRGALPRTQDFPFHTGDFNATDTLLTGSGVGRGHGIGW